MATVTGYTAARMQEIEDSAIVDGVIVGDNLILTRHDGATIDAGDVRGPQGDPGSTGDTAVAIVTSTTRPSSPYDGLIIYETDTKRYYSWNGSAWKYIGGEIICTSTTLPSAPFTGLSIYVTDTKQHFTWNGSVWDITDTYSICTSTTRPTNLTAGMSIYETDTKRTYTYNGAIWIPASGQMRCKANRNAVQAIPNNASTDIIWTTQEYDTDAIWTPGGTANSFIIPTNGVGLWRFVLDAQFAINGVGVRHFGLLKNAVALATWNGEGNSVWFAGSNVTGETVCAAGDIIKAYAYQSSGAALNVDNSYPVSLSAVFLGS